MTLIWETTLLIAIPLPTAIKVSLCPGHVLCRHSLRRRALFRLVQTFEPVLCALIIIFLPVVPYLNYSTFSEPGDDHHGAQATTSMPHLDPFDEEDWDISMASSLPTEFDMRPDLTPTGEEGQSLTFEIPAVRGSPSRGRDHLDDDCIPEELSGDEKRRASSSNGSAINKPIFRIPQGSQPMKKLFAVVRTSILSSLLLLLLFSCLIVFIIESESDLFSHLRKLPEMVVLRRDYYEPFKKSFFHMVSR